MKVSIEFKVLERQDPPYQACRIVGSRDRGTASFLRSALRGSVWVEALLQDARLHGSSTACEIVQEMICSP